MISRMILPRLLVSGVEYDEPVGKLFKLDMDTTVAALAQMRTRGGGPHYIRVARHIDSRGYVRGPIRYTRRDLIEWLRERRHANTAGEV